MSYRLKDEAKDMELPPGVPRHDLTDAEYAAVSEQYDRKFRDQPGSLVRFFEHIPDDEPQARPRRERPAKEV